MSGPAVDSEGAKPAVAARLAVLHLDAVREYSLLVVVVVLQAAITWHFASQSFFHHDDFVQFEEAARQGLSIGYLRNPSLGQLSPGSRLVSFLIQHYATLDWGVALGFLLAVHSAGVVLLHRILRLFVGPAWWTFPVVFAYGISIIFMPSFEWFSAGLGRFWVVTTGLAAIYAYLCWRRTGRTAWLAWSVVAVAAGLFFSIQGILTVLYLVLIRLLLLDEIRVRDFARTIAREWRIWGLYAIPVGVFLVASFATSGTQTWQSAPFGQVMDFLHMAWVETFIPALFGVYATDPLGTPPTYVTDLCQLVLVGAVATSVLRRRSAWRAWAVLVIAFLVTAVAVVPRVDELGPIVAKGLRYYVDLVFLVPIVVLFAFSRPRVNAGPASTAPSPSATKVAIAAATVTLIGYVALTLATDSAIMRRSDGKVARAWFANIRADVEKLRRTGARPDLLDGPVPVRMLPFWVKPGANQISAILPLVLSGLRFDTVSDRTFRINDHGHLQALTFQQALAGSAQELAARGILTVRGAKPDARGKTLCVSADRGWASVEVVPPQVLRGQQWYLRSTYRTSPRGLMFLAVNRGVPYPQKWDRALPPRPAGGTVLTQFGSLPPPAVPTLGRFKIDMPPGRSACFDRFVIGWYAPQA